MSNVSENLFQAMDIIIAERLNGLNYDKTILCKIEDDSKKDKGEYTVTDGASTFIAISKDATYTKGSSVYVTVPTGDFNQQKLIVGRYIANNEQYATYQAPFELYLEISENLIEDAVAASLLANGETEEKIIWTWRADQGSGLRGYSRLGFNAKFKSWLAAMEPIAGTYGIRIDITGTEKTTTEEPTISKSYKYFLTSDEFYGDPYNFDVFYKQEKVFDISKIAEITFMQITFFQNKGSFLDKEKDLLPAVDEFKNPLMDNIWISDVVLSVGYAVSDFSEDTVLLYTFDSETYAAESQTKTKPDGSPLNEKTLHARWLHFDEEGVCAAIDKEEEMAEYEEKNNAKIHWYKHVLQDGVCDDLAGNFWQEVNDNQANKNLLYTFNPDITAATETYKVIIEMPSLSSVQTEIDDKTWEYYESWGIEAPTSEKIEEWRAGTEDVTDPDTDTVISRADAITKIDEYLLEMSTTLLSTVKYYESESFTFTNEAHVPDQATLELVQGLSIIVDAVGLKGNYCIYGQTNEILNSTEGHKMRTMEARYESLITNDKRLDKASTIRWKIPAYGTMIYPPENGKEYIPMPDEYIVDGEVKIPEDDKDKLLYANREGYIGDTKYIFIDENGKLVPIEGYYIIERNGTEQYPEGGLDADGDGKEDTAEQISVMQDFRIESYYTPQNTNNTVHCEIIKNGLTYKASSTLVFGPQGTNGTDSTLVLKFKDDQSAIDKDGSIKVEAHLYDYNNTEVQIEPGSLTWQWWKNTDGFEAKDSVLKIGNTIWIEKTIVSTEVDAAGNELSTEQKITYPEVEIQWNSDESVAMHNILQCNVKYGNATIGAQALDGVDLENNEALEEEVTTREVNLQAFTPIPFRENPRLTWAEIPTRIVYDDQGKNPTYYKNAFAITTSGNVEGYVSGAEVIFDDIPANYVYYPSVKHRDDDSSAPGYFLEPKNMFFSNLTNKVTLKVTVAFNEGGQINYYNWYQPILIIQNRWPSAMMNAWDGSLTIDEKNGTILSTMVGAGKKEDDNTFTGVLMGDIATGAGYEDKQLGVYGFNHGQQSFGFKDDGTAFIGKAGKGRIEFDGNSGRIQSMSYSQTKNEKVKSGMLIDLDDGIIEMHGATKGGNNGNFENNTYEGSGAMVRLNVADNSEPYFEIHTATEDDPLETDPAKQKSRPIMIVGLKDYRLQSADFKQEKTNEPGSGMQIDLNEGRILGYDFELKGVDPNDGSFFHMSSDGKPYLQIHHVDKEKNQDLDIVNITKTKFTLQSQDWSSQNKTGTQLKLDTGKITSYNFDLYAAKKMSDGSTKTIQLDSTAENTPFNVNNNFKLNWDGSFQAAGGDFKVDADGKFKATQGEIGPFKFSSTAFYTGSSSYGSGGIYMSSGGTMSLGSKLKYDGSTLTLANANINDATISKGTITDANISKGTIDEATITQGSIDDAEIKNCNITTGMKLSGDAVVKKEIKFLTDVSLSSTSTYVNVVTGLTTDSENVEFGILESIFSDTFLANVGYYYRSIFIPKKMTIKKKYMSITTLSTEGSEDIADADCNREFYAGNQMGPKWVGKNGSSSLDTGDAT